MKKTFHQIENISEEKEIILKNQKEILRLISTAEVKISLEGLNKRFELAEKTAKQIRLIEIV